MLNSPASSVQILGSVSVRRKWSKFLFRWANALLFFLVPMNGRIIELVHIEGGPNLIPISLWLVFLGAILIPSLRFKPVWNNKFFKLFFFLFLLYALSAFWFNSISEAFEVVSRKLSFIIIPFVVFSRPGFYLKEAVFLLRAYGFGILFALLLLDIYGLRFYLSNGEIPFYAAYSDVFHPTYLGLNILLFLIAHLYRSARVQFTWRSGIFYVIIMGALLLHIFLLLSKAIIIVTAIVLLYFSVVYARRGWRNLLVYFSVFLLPFFLIVPVPHLLDKSAEKVKLRFEELTQSKQDNGSTSFRTLVLKNAPEIIDEHWLFGVGFGNETAYLSQFYQERGWEHARSRSFNTHNQFLQTWLSIGIGGLFILAILIFGPFMLQISPIVKLMLFSFVFIFCTEAMLERLSGIVLFLLFYSLFVGLTHSLKSKRKPRTINI